MKIVAPGSDHGFGIVWEQIDAGVALFLFVLDVVALDQAGHVSAAGVATSALLSGAVVLRRRFPEAVVVVLLGVLTAYDHSSGSASLPGESPAIVLVYYMLGRRSVIRGWPVVDALLVLAPVPAIAAAPNTAGPGGSLLVGTVSVWLFFLVIPFGAGRVVGSRSLANERLRATTEQLDRDRHERAERARAAERARIAREVHDVIAHSVSTMVIQTAAARRVASGDPAAAARALVAVEECGRDALVDLRRLVGVVHSGDVDLLGGAAPGVAELARLAARAGAMGLRVGVRVEGAQRALSAALDLVVFRVVQEALTNAIKYAGPGEANVVVAFGEAELCVEVTDSGGRPTRPQQPVAGGGQGLIGMRERVAMFDGRLTAGPRAGGSFCVRAVIPIDPAVLR